MAVLILTGSGDDSVALSSVVSMVSAIGSNWLVNWMMGTVVPLAGVIRTGGSVGPVGLLLGVSVQLFSSSIWFVLSLLCGYGRRRFGVTAS